MNATKVLTSMIDPLVILFVVMTISGVFKETGAMSSIYSILKPRMSSKRGLVAILSLVFGVVPITTRIGFACGMLDSVQDKTRNNQKMGTIAYLASHHYYLWSPIEKSIIITTGVLGINYLQFMAAMWVPALIAIVFSIVYIFANVTEDEIYLKEAEQVDMKSVLDVAYLFVAIALGAVYSNYMVHIFSSYAAFLVVKHGKFQSSWIDWKILGMTAAVIVFGAYVGTFDKQLTAQVKSIASGGGIVGVAVFAYLAAFIMGSSAKFAAMCGMLTRMLGIQYLPLLYLVEYAGYLISPAHKCVAIGKMYFKTPHGMYFIPIILLSIILIIYAVLALLL